VHAGIYAIDRLNDRSRWMAAVLACRAGAVLSHRSAGALWGFGDEGPRVDVSARAALGARVRASTSIEARRSIPVT
jgi:hypothetical protein